VDDYLLVAVFASAQDVIVAYAINRAKKGSRPKQGAFLFMRRSAIGV
jgi:hypothetical protein